MKKRMYRLLSLMIVAAMAFGIAGCSIKPKTEDKKDEISQSVSEEEPEEDESVSEDETSEAEKEAEKEESAETSESSAEVNAESGSSSLKENESASETPESNAEVGEVFPGPDIVELVNLRGDETTAYKLADGRYMDRQDTVFIFDGADTWVQEGTEIEWNEKAK